MSISIQPCTLASSRQLILQVISRFSCNYKSDYLKYVVLISWSMRKHSELRNLKMSSVIGSVDYSTCYFKTSSRVSMHILLKCLLSAKLIGKRYKNEKQNWQIKCSWQSNSETLSVHFLYNLVIIIPILYLNGYVMQVVRLYSLFCVYMYRKKIFHKLLAKGGSC